MRVLGVSPLDKDASASAVEDGRVLFAAGEERFSRIKQHAGFPERALAAALAHTGWAPGDVDAVVYAFFDAEREEQLIRAAIEAALAADRARHADGLAALLHAADARASEHAAAGPRCVPGLSRPEQRMEKGLA